MGDYVDREKIVMDILGLTIVDPAVMQYADAVLRIVQSAQKENVVPLIHGKWIWELAEDGWANHICSVCKYTKHTDIHVIVDWDYCPKCGAKMDEK